mgnify:CR=1 FL=1
MQYAVVSEACAQCPSTLFTAVICHNCTDQDARFADKEKKLLRSMKFPPEYSQKVDPTKVNWEVMKPWIAKRVTELLGGLEDEVLIAYIYEQVEGKKVSQLHSSWFGSLLLQKGRCLLVGVGTQWTRQLVFVIESDRRR